MSNTSLKIDNPMIKSMLNSLATSTQELYELRGRYTELRNKKYTGIIPNECGENFLLFYKCGTSMDKFETIEVINYIHPSFYWNRIFTFSIKYAHSVSMSIDDYLRDWFIMPIQNIPIFYMTVYKE